VIPVQRHFIALAFSAVAFFAAARPARGVIGYYPGWRQWDRQFLVKPTTIDYTKFSVINFAFLQPHADGAILTGR
jgi:GH18 family chitinase